MVFITIPLGIAYIISRLQALTSGNGAGSKKRRAPSEHSKYEIALIFLLSILVLALLVWIILWILGVNSLPIVGTRNVDHSGRLRVLLNAADSDESICLLATGGSSVQELREVSTYDCEHSTRFHYYASSGKLVTSDYGMPSCLAVDANKNPVFEGCQSSQISDHTTSWRFHNSHLCTEDSGCLVYNAAEDRFEMRDLDDLEDVEVAALRFS
ncbi:MAG: hypothetical protein CMD68_00055 [Gammaproteobacteria bacterium]|nr:hypothetical protein [Gammaproteobacteria bacterium]